MPEPADHCVDEKKAPFLMQHVTHQPTQSLQSLVKGQSSSAQCNLRTIVHYFFLFFVFITYGPHEIIYLLPILICFTVFIPRLYQDVLVCNNLVPHFTDTTSHYRTHQSSRTEELERSLPKFSLLESGPGTMGFLIGCCTLIVLQHMTHVSLSSLTPLHYRGSHFVDWVHIQPNHSERVTTLRRDALYSQYLINIILIMSSEAVSPRNDRPGKVKGCLVLSDFYEEGKCQNRCNSST